MAETIQHPGSRVWVDVRSEAAHERIRIPGSLHIPLYAVKSKSFLRTRSVVLVDDGYGSHVLEEEVRLLRNMGFDDLAIWYGGIHTWHQLGGTLVGTVDDSLGLLPPVVLMDVRHVTDWLIVDAGTGEGTHLPGVKTLPFDPERPEVFVAAVNAMIETNPEVRSILLVTDQGDYDPALLAAAAGIWGFVYRLEGGWTGWLAYQQQMDALHRGGTVVSRSATGVNRSGGRGCRACPK